MKKNVSTGPFNLKLAALVVYFQHAYLNNSMAS